MKTTKIKKNRNITRFRNDYYVVDDKTSVMLEAIQRTTTVQDFAIEMNISEKRASKKLKQIQKCLSSERCYKRNLFLENPIKVQWKITNKCNLKCKHCYLGELSQESLSTSEINEIARKIVASGVLEVTITGGEALLVDNLPEIIYKFVENENYVKVFTNATLLVPFLEKIGNMGLLDKFREYVTFSISVDGLENTHDKIRGKGTFQKVESALMNLQKLKFTTIVNCVVSKLNVAQIPELLLYLLSLNVCNIQLSNIIIKGNADKSMALNRAEKDALASRIKRISSDHNVHILYGEEDGFENIHYFDSEITEGYFKESWKCCAGVTRMTIDYDGNVYCCPFCKEFCLGNIKSSDVSLVWNNKNRFEFLDKLSKTKTKNGRMCVIATEEENYE